MANSPDHYNNTWEVGDFIRNQGLNFHLGNAIKYICRCDLKGDRIKDLTKAIHYLQNELENTIYESELTGPSGTLPVSLLFDDGEEPERLSEVFN
tara:strand:+ start:85 stop:369 length:285 start_codon:yes stop_codon:yes gene_type:complete